MSNDYYDINVNQTPGEGFPYENCETSNVELFKHQELPQNLKYVAPQLSPDEKYVSVIGKGDTHDYVFIWKIDQLTQYLYMYKGTKIGGFCFSPNSSSFIILYENIEPMHYSIKNGKSFSKLTKVGQKDRAQVKCYSFSKHGKYFVVGFEDKFTIWNASTGEVKKNLEDPSPSKYVRGNVMISITDDCRIKVTTIKDETKICDFKLRSITSHKDILACALSPVDRPSEVPEFFYYAIREGIYKCQIKVPDDQDERTIELVQKFDSPAEKAFISADCEEAMSTNNRDIYFWNFGQQKLGSVYKEDFYECSIFFENGKVLTVDEICINITDYSDGDKDELFIWLNKNPTKFESFNFSPEFSYLLTKINEHEAVLYNCNTGHAVKKWKNSLPLWNHAVLIAPETSQTAIIATKSTNDIAKIWDYQNGNEIMTLVGFNVYNFCFSPAGNLLACGGFEGTEMARVWDLTSDTKFESFNHQGQNEHTYVHLTRAEPYILICVPERQKPVIFDVENVSEKFECDSDVNFTKVDVVDSNSSGTLFFVKGVDEEGDNSAMLFDLNQGKMLRHFKNCVNIDFSQDGKYLLCKSDYERGDLVVYDIENDILDFKFKSCEIKAELSSFLQGGKAIVSPFGDQNKMNFILSDPETGKMVGEVEYKKKHNEYVEVDLSADPETNSLIFRYIQLTSFNQSNQK